MPDAMNRVTITRKASLLAGALAMAATTGSLPLAAQEVVQGLAPRESAQLSAAMRRLAQRPSDLEALVSAGNAALALNDASAAAGFFTRAAVVAPADSRVMLGQARVALEQRRPVDALEGFARAEKAGVRATDMAADRALAYDLVGDNGAAQQLYRGILATGENVEVRRRLALSLAISGNRPEFEKTLYPMLRDEDRSAYRTRAFGLAILGLTDDAVEIADAMMPTDLALRMAPYLRYMPRLTKAQQAAAGNLGAFPAAADIGRDSADIAGYAAAGARIAARGDTSLTPSGPALGPRTATASLTPAPAGATRPGAAAAKAPTITVPGGGAVRIAQAELPPVRTTQSSPAPAPAPAPAPSPSPAPATAPLQTQPRPSVPVPSAPQTSAPSGARAQAVVVASAPLAPQGSAPAPAPAPAAERPSLEDAFADLATPPAARATPIAGSVDVARLAAARRAEEAKAKKEADARAARLKKEADAKAAKAKAEKAAREAEPARIWLQVGVGRNVDAFAFDWKRLARQAGSVLDGKGPWAVKYGASNRMLAGPFTTEAAARAALKALKDKDIDALPYRSSEGEKVTKAS